MKRLAFCAAALLSMAVAFAKPAQVLMPGDPAPELTVSQWVKGSPIPKLEEGRVYVVEMWATWCGPCRVSIPHLTKLQQKHGDKVTIIGISIWERGDDIPKLVRDFVAQMGDQMNYHVAMDSTDGGTEKNWMEAAKQRGIPASFIIGKDRKIAWIGHPMAMDKPLEDVIAGTFDVAAARASFEQEMQAQIREEEGMKKIGEARQMAAGGKRQEALAALDAVQKENPGLAMPVFQTKADILSSNEAEFSKFIADSTKALGEEAPMILANTALSMIRAPRGQQPAEAKVKAGRMLVAEALKGMGKTDNAIVLYYVSVFHLNLNEKAAAVPFIERALKVVPDNADNKQFRDALNQLLQRAKSSN